ncbi:hypothetical protein HY469_04110, partial [Candidatus Roizmanbacteria bacterium]|nr:hypothetical protein [Candidatus Roizmanbacteria bacterium]
SILAQTPPTLPAFPGAEGYGRFSVGGRGGQVFIINTLADPVPVDPSSTVTSLRECVIANGPRTCVFAVTGLIETSRELTIRNPYITIAGQTSQGDGITIKSGANVDACISIRSHDVIISNIKCRPGTGGTSLPALTPTPGARTGDAVDSFSSCCGSDAGYDNYNYMLSHVSGSWSVDEVFDFGYARDITLQDSMCSEPLNHATHSYTADDPDIGHSKCSLLWAMGSGNVSYIRNLFAHAMDRYPEINPSDGYVDLVNNVFYNWGTTDSTVGGRSWVTHFSGHYGNPQVNVVGNYYKPGPNSDNRHRLRFDNPTSPDNPPLTPVGNTMTVYLDNTIDTTLGEITTVYKNQPGLTINYSSTPLGDAAYSIVSADQAYQQVTNPVGAGDSFRIDCSGNKVARSDPVDTRIKNDVLNGTGQIIDSPSEVGGWPTIASVPACGDQDADGMPDTWETAYGLNASINDSALDQNGDGYTNIEDYIFGISAAGVPTPTLPAVRGDTNGDSKVDMVDLSTLLANFGGTEKTRLQGDVSGNDGVVSVADLSTLLANFGMQN